MSCLFVAVPGPQGSPVDGGYNMVMFMVAWLVIATALFLMRPASLRNRGDNKPPQNQVHTYFTDNLQLSNICFFVGQSCFKHVKLERLSQ